MRYIAKDIDTRIYGYERKPVKGEVTWVVDFGRYKELSGIDSSLKDFVSWEDEEPFDIEEYLRNRRGIEE